MTCNLHLKRAQIHPLLLLGKHPPPSACEQVLVPLPQHPPTKLDTSRSASLAFRRFDQVTSEQVIIDMLDVECFGHEGPERPRDLRVDTDSASQGIKLRMSGDGWIYNLVDIC